MLLISKYHKTINFRTSYDKEGMIQVNPGDNELSAGDMADLKDHTPFTELVDLGLLILAEPVKKPKTRKAKKPEPKPNKDEF